MPMFHITDETMRMIREVAIHEFRQTGQRRSDGTWLISVTGELAARLRQVALAGETIDETIQRAIREQRGVRPD